MNKQITRIIRSTDKKPIKVILRAKKKVLPPSKTLYSKYV